MVNVNPRDCFMHKVSWLGILELNRVNCNARTTCTNSSGVEPDLGLDQDQQ